MLKTEMTDELRQASPVDARQERRTSLFVMATLYANSGSWPVRVRDLSSAGALVEGAILPPEGTSIRLNRGTLSVVGEIIWCRDGRAGLRFDSNLSVADWLPRGRASMAQQRVDEMVQHAKSSITADPPVLAAQQLLQSKKINVGELEQLGAAIDSLALDLAADEHVFARHMAKLQTLDLVSQTLRKLALER